MTLRELFIQALSGAIDLETQVVVCDRKGYQQQEIRSASVFISGEGKRLGICLEDSKSNSIPAVSGAWVLNQLAGLSFPQQGGAYDYMKRCLENQ